MAQLCKVKSLRHVLELGRISGGEYECLPPGFLSGFRQDFAVLEHLARWQLGDVAPDTDLCDLGGLAHAFDDALQQVFLLLAAAPCPDVPVHEVIVLKGTAAGERLAGIGLIFQPTP